MKCTEFPVTISAPLGPRMGRVFLQIDGTEVSGYLTLFNIKNYFQGKVLRKNHYIVTLTLQMGESLLDCDMLIFLKEGLWHGCLLSNRGCWVLEGVQMTAAEKEKCSDVDAKNSKEKICNASVISKSGEEGRQ